MLHNLGLFFHMTGIMLASGGSIGAILAERQLWKKVSNYSRDAKALIPILQSAITAILIGMIVFLVSGLIMLYSVNWIFLTQPWFITKLILFLILPLRGALVAKPAIAFINTQLQVDNYNLSDLMKEKSKMKRFHFIQFLLVAAIIFLAIFKVG